MCRYISSVSDKMTTTAVPSVGRGVAHSSAVGGRPRLGTHIDTCRYIQTHTDTYRHIQTHIYTVCRHAARRPRPAAEHLPALRLPADHRQHGRGPRHPAHLVPVQGRAQRQVSYVNI